MLFLCKERGCPFEWNCLGYLVESPLTIPKPTVPLMKPPTKPALLVRICRTNSHPSEKRQPVLEPSYCLLYTSGVQYKKDDGFYSPSENKLVFSYPLQKYIDNGRSKYHTLAHEYGHYFDKKANYGGLHFKEVETIHSKTKYQINRFAKIASSSDEFLTAVRKDRRFLKSILTCLLYTSCRDQSGH